MFYNNRISIGYKQVCKRFERGNLLKNIFLFSPGNMYVIRSVSLNAGSLHPRSTALAFVLEQSGNRDHDAVVYAESLVRRIERSVPFFAHDTHHFLQPLVATHAAHDQHLVRSYMRHRPFCNALSGMSGNVRERPTRSNQLLITCDFNEHGEHSLLQRKT